MQYTLNRIEENIMAVLIDENGNRSETFVSCLPEERTPGSVYDYIGESFVYNEEATIKQKNKAKEKLSRLLSKNTNKQEEK